MSDPRVSLILTCYRQEAFVAQAVVAALQQDYSPLEIVISDDASPDGTYEVVERVVREYQGPHEVVLHRNAENLGPIENTLRTTRRARGELVVRCHGDDISVPERVRTVAGVHRRHRPTLISSDAMQIDARGRLLGRAAEGCAGGPVPASEVADQGWTPRQLGATFAWHRELWERFGPLPRDIISSAGDHVLPFRAALLRGAFFIDRPLVLWRRHGAQLTAAMGANLRQDVRAGDHHIAHAVAARYAQLVDLRRAMEAGGPDAARRLAPLEATLVQRIVQQGFTWVRIRALMQEHGFRPRWDARTPGAGDDAGLRQALVDAGLLPRDSRRDPG